MTIGSSNGPVFVLGVQRGGTNLVLNLLRSHPECCWPDGELHEVIRGRRSDGMVGVLRKAIWYLPIAARHGDILHPMRVPNAGLLSGILGWVVRRAIDRSVASNRANVRAFQAQLGTHGEMVPGQGQRMVCKVVNGNVALARDIGRLYGNARFVGVVRHPFAVCEGLMRRGASCEQAIHIYNVFAKTLIEMEDEGHRLVALRYEDVVRDPTTSARQAYAHCDLDGDRVEWVCLQEKGANPDGSVNKVNRCYRLTEMAGHMRAGLNQEQAERLSHGERDVISRQCGVAMRRFGYDSVIQSSACA